MTTEVEKRTIRAHEDRKRFQQWDNDEILIMESDLRWMYSRIHGLRGWGVSEPLSGSKQNKQRKAWQQAVWDLLYFWE
jgi:hypothetical protein